MAKKVKMADIAQRLGVSTVTVSKALTGKDGVSEVVRKKILTLAADMGYQAKAGAAKSRIGEMVGVLISERFLYPNESYYQSIYERVLSVLDTRKMFGVMERISQLDEKGKVVPRLVQGGQVQSLIAIGSFTLDYLMMLRCLGLPVVQIGGYHIRSGLDTIISDGYCGVF